MTRRCLFALLCTALLVAGCGGGGGGDDDDPLAALQGRWFGPRVAGSLAATFDDAGTITEWRVDNVKGVRTGTITHVGGSYYEGQLNDSTQVRLFLAPSGRYAAAFGEFELACLELGATALPVGGFLVADIAPDDYVGSNLRLDVQARLDSISEASAAINADGSYSGSDSSGLTFGSPAATGLVPDSGILLGPYQDSAHATVGFLDVLPSPDRQFLVAGAFPEANTINLNAEFIGVWDRD